MKTKTVIEYILDIWMDNKTILNEKIIVQENAEEIIDVVREKYGPDASYNAAKENRVFTF